MKTKDLIGPTLDWAVAKCEGFAVVVVTVEYQSLAHERVTREHYSDAEWVEHLANWNKHVLPTLRPRLAVLDSEGFPNGFPFHRYGLGVGFDFCNDWSQGGPIIDREGISLKWHESDNTWSAYTYSFAGFAETPLIAAMRCYVASKLGNEVEIPGGLK